MLLLLASGSCDWLATQTLPAESLAREQNAVVSTYVNDIQLIHISSRLDAAVACVWILRLHLLMNSSLRLDISFTTSLLLASGCKLPADSCDCSLKPSAEYDDVTDDVINANPSADSYCECKTLSFQFIHATSFAIANSKYQQLVEALC
ncbi:TMV resistance protein N-like [Dorcoceras hygrometricum]|uniref:TMV resistance protein N-like n=1 Tax=Dorcoceras hygrometricum TaxID=472368 RepID=A0A2Z7A6S2_9LAMI|nr:TMV resistance protein N-like [Dorcoceras hygrometricum]